MRNSPIQITLSSDERNELEHITRCTTVKLGLALRARMVLMFAGGKRINSIAEELKRGRRIVSKWLERYQKERLKGLADLPRPGRKPVFSPGGGHSSGQNRLRDARQPGAFAFPLGLRGTGLENDR